MTPSTRLLIVGNPAPFHVGAHFLRAAQSLDIPVTLCDTNRANGTSQWAQRLYWHLGGHRPPHLRTFGEWVLQTCEVFQPTHVLSTGLAALTGATLAAIGKRGIQRLNFLTDDPWNPAHRASWFMQAIPHYDVIFTPRQANLEQLKDRGTKVYYLPFGYDPSLHRIPDSDECQTTYNSGVVFVGGADRDRLPLINALIRAGITPRLYGGYWERYPETRPFAQGHATADQLRCITYNADINVCLVRRANRDSHVMRTFEIAACGGTMVAEDTADHRAFFGAEGSAVLYFKTEADLIQKCQWLLTHTSEAHALRAKIRRIITTHSHTYAARLNTILTTVVSPVGTPC